MTIAISIKVNNGVVLASDSAATIFAQTPDGQNIGVIHVYENAEKLFNLCKGHPIGAITWGSESIGRASISSLIKDFRKELSSNIKDGIINVEEISNKLAHFIFDRNYIPSFEKWKNKPPLGFMVAGYSEKKDFAEEWKFEILNGVLKGPEIVRKQDQIGCMWNGEPEALTRLILGHSAGLEKILRESSIEDTKIKEILTLMENKLAIPFVMEAMPIKDVIDLAQFFVETTIKFSKFGPGAPSVGGPIDIASITKHEGFKWIMRKHYYNNTYNPELKEE